RQSVVSAVVETRSAVERIAAFAGEARPERLTSNIRHLFKLAGDEIGRAVLLEAKLGVCMQVLPPGGHVAMKQIDEMWDLHSEPLHDKPTQMLSPDSRRSAEIGNNRPASPG